jgi:hypothetical protein
VCEKYVNPTTGKMELIILPAAIALIDRIKKVSLLVFMLSTFGPDGEKLVVAYDKCGIQISCRVKMHPEKGMQLVTEKGEAEEWITGEKLLETLLEKRYIFAQEDFEEWRRQGEKAGSSKIVHCSGNGRFKEKDFVTIFVDDNFKNRIKTKDIGYPKDVKNLPTNWNSRGVIGIPVPSPLRCALDPNHLVDLVNEGLKKRYFLPI